MSNKQIRLREWVKTTFETYSQNKCLSDQTITLSYRDVWELSSQVVHYFKKLNLKKQSKILCYYDRSYKHIIIQLACVRSEMIFMPLDTKSPRDRLQKLAAEFSANLLITDNNSVQVDGCPVVTLDQLLQGSKEIFEETQESITSENPIIYTIFTSGSTGVPKAVPISESNLLNLCTWHISEFNVTEKSNGSQLASQGFDASIWEVWPYLLAGASITWIPDNLKSNSRLLSHWLVDNEITHTFIPTALVPYVWEEDWDRKSSLKVMLTGGDKLTGFPSKKIPFRIINNYGPTENTVVSTFYELENNSDYSVPPIGNPIPNVEVMIVDENGDEVSDENPGELWISGKSLTQGYLNNEHANNVCFSQDKQGKRYYKTGDIVKRDHTNTLLFLGRKDSQISLGGYRIECGEIENAMLAVQGIKEAVVILNITASNTKELVAFYTAANTLPESEIKAALKKILPEYMIPKRIIQLDAFTYTNNGKINRSELPLQTSSKIEMSEGKSVQEQVLDIIKSYTSLSSISPEQSIYQIGIDSINSIEITAEINKNFKLSFYPETILESKTIGEFISQIMSEISQEVVDNDASSVSIASLLPSQEGIWSMMKMMPDMPVYHEPFIIEFNSKVDIPKLEQAIHQVISKNESLRTGFYQSSGKPETVINDTVQSNITVFSGNLETRAQEFISAPFNLKKGPLIRFALNVMETKDTLMGVIHHIISDATSLKILKEQLEEAYFLPEEYQKTALEKQLSNCKRKKVSAKEEAFWKKAITQTDSPKLLNKTTKNQTFEGDICKAEVLNKTRISEFCSQQNCTEFDLFMSTFYLLLYRYTSEDTHTIGTVLSNRLDENDQQIIGPLYDTVPIEAAVNSSESFLELLNKVKSKKLSCYKHRIPFTDLVSLHKPNRNFMETPFFNYALVLEPYQSKRKSTIENWELTQSVFSGFAKFDLYLRINEHEQGFLIRTEYRKSLFEKSFVNRFLNHYITLLDQVISTPEEVIGNIQFITEEEKRFHDGLNTAKQPIDYEKGLLGFFKDRVLISPDSIAIRHKEKTMSYQQLDQITDNLSRHLQQIKEQNVGIYCDRSIEFILAVISLIKAGKVYVPVSRDYPEERVRHSCDMSSLKTMLTTASFKHELKNIPVELLDINELQRTHVPINNNYKPSPQKLAYIMFTSGSTGIPKGIPIQQKSIIRLVKHQNYMEFTDKDVIPHLSNVAFDASTMEIWGTLLNGGELVIFEKEDVLDFPRFESLLYNTGCTKLFITTVLFQRLAIEQPTFAKSLQQLLIGGEELNATTINNYVTFCKNHQYSVRLANIYGPTENTTYSMYYPITNLQPARVPIGKAIVNTTVKLVDMDLNPIPIGGIGEVLLGGDGLSAGYLKDDVLTQEKFVNLHGQTFYRSGDFCTLNDDGNVVYLFRKDAQIKLFGNRIEIPEIQKAIAALPSIKECAVTLEKTLSGNKVLVAFITQDEKRPIAEYKAALELVLPYYSIPSEWVILDSFQLTANGKIDFKVLENKYLSQRHSTLPKTGTSTSAVLKKIWGEVLGRETVTETDNFFDLGGDSISLVYILEKLHQNNYNNILITDLYTYTSINELSNFIDKSLPVADINIQSSNADKRKAKLKAVRAKRSQREKRLHG